MTPRFLALLLLFGASVFSRAAAERRPNFVIILADDMGYADASCYGNTAYRTPNIDALAESGLRFTDFHSSGAVCSPTRAGFLTGRYQQRAGIPGVINADPGANRHHGLRTNEVTFAELLRQVGYATGVVGKWHLGYEKQFNPAHHGFEFFRGYVSGNIDYHSHFDRMGVLDWWDGLEVRDEAGYSTHLVTRHAIEFVRRNQAGPFCLYMAYESPHDPYQGPNDPAIRVAGRVVPNTYPPGQIDRAYREMVQEMDRGIGELVAALNQTGLAENTCVFFFSDNGATPRGNNGPLRGFKGGIYEGGHRVPGIAWWPGRIKPGHAADEPAISLDLMPTMLELAGVAPPRGHKLDGVSLAPVLFRGERLAPRTVFWDVGQGQAVRQGPWKLVVSNKVGATRKKKKRATETTTSPALFNLAEDLGEKNDLAARHPERVRNMLGALNAWKADVALGATVQPDKRDL